MQTNQKGNTIITAPIILTISIFCISLLFTLSINLIMPFVWYQKLSNIALKYMFIIENYGYLTQTEKQYLELELTNQGFNKDKIKIESTSTLKEYGEPVFLNISYDYKINISYFNKTIKMTIWKNGVSKH